MTNTISRKKRLKHCWTFAASRDLPLTSADVSVVGRQRETENNKYSDHYLS